MAKQKLNNTEKLKQLISDQTGVNTSSISEKTELNQLGFDSFDIIDLIMTVEDTFDIIIKDDKNIHSIGDLLNHLS